MNNSINSFFENIKKTVSDKLPTFIGSLFIFIIFMIIAIIINNSITGDTTINIVDDETNIPSKTLIHHQIGSVVYYLIIIVGIIFSIINLGFNITTIITILASLGLAIGIAMQGTLSNIISGVIISINNVYNINDFIRINQLINDKDIKLI